MVRSGWNARCNDGSVTSLDDGAVCCANRPEDSSRGGIMLVMALRVVASEVC